MNQISSNQTGSQLHVATAYTYLFECYSLLEREKGAD